MIIPRRNKVCGGKIIKRIYSYIFSKDKRRCNYVEKFEKEIAKFIGSRYALLTSSGRKGLSLIIDYYSFPKRSEIILPAYTLKDLVFIIKEKGYIPVFVDINPQTYNIEASLIEEKISKKTVMIIATHIFGMPCEIDKIVEISRKHKIVVIEDCAHAMGARYKGKRVGTFTEASFFSLELSKPINTFGGGAVVTNNGGLKDYIRNEIKKYPQPGMKLFTKVITSILEDLVIHSFIFSFLVFLFYFKFTKILVTHLYLFFSRRVNIKDFAYTNLQAFLGLLQLKELDNRNKMLMEKIFQMRKHFKKSINYQKNLYGSIPAFYLNSVKTDNSSQLMRKRLLRSGIDVGIKDEITDNCPAHFKSELSYLITRDCYDKLLHLPMSSDVDIKIIKKVADAVNSSLK